MPTSDLGSARDRWGSDHSATGVRGDAHFGKTMVSIAEKRGWAAEDPPGRPGACLVLIPEAMALCSGVAMSTGPKCTLTGALMPDFD
jgi:hypothetical protein